MDESFWGEIDTEKIITPKSILEKQGEFLKEATKNQVYIEVERDVVEERTNKDSELIFNFLVKGKNMGNFSYKLFSIVHPIDLYPLMIRIDEKTFKEIKHRLNKDIFGPRDVTVRANDEVQYISLLKSILATNRANNLIKGILGLSSKQDGMF